MEPMLGSGPYRIADVDPGRSITYERVPRTGGLAPCRRISASYNFDTHPNTSTIGTTTVRTEQAFIGGEFDIMTTVQSPRNG